MPDRYVRAGIITSRRVNQLSDSAEVFYRRLHSVADDHGRYEADVQLLRPTLYPLRVDSVTREMITGWLVECVDAGLITLYRVQGKDYLIILDFGQRIRSASKCPDPEDGEVLGGVDVSPSDVSSMQSAACLVRKSHSTSHSHSQTTSRASFASAEVEAVQEPVREQLRGKPPAPLDSLQWADCCAKFPLEVVAEAAECAVKAGVKRGAGVKSWVLKRCVGIVEQREADSAPPPSEKSFEEQFPEVAARRKEREQPYVPPTREELAAIKAKYRGLTDAGGQDSAAIVGGRTSNARSLPDRKAGHRNRSPDCPAP